jgi:hypothetical protein
VDITAQRVLRRFFAALLTKEWLMAVRRGWVKLLASLKPKGWSGVFRSFDKVIQFTTNLQDQVLYVRRGPYTSIMTMSDSRKLVEAFTHLQKEIRERRDTAEHWARVYNDPVGEGRGTFTKEQADHMLNLFESKFGEMLTTRVKARGTPDGTREANVTELLDDILKMLRDDAARLKEDLDRGDAASQETRQKFDAPVYKQFDLYGMKVVVDDRTVSANLIKEYIKYLDQAYHMLRAKKLDRVWYGTVFIRCEDCGGMNYNTGGGVGGNFHIGPNFVNIFSRPGPFIVELMAHELGHRYWFKHMAQGQRAKFEALVRAHKSRKPGVSGLKPIDDSKVKQGKDKIAEAQKKMLSAFDIVKAPSKKFPRDVLNDQGDKIARAGWDFAQEMLSAMHAPGADSQINDEVKQLFKDAMDSYDVVRRAAADFQEDVQREMNREPEPAKAPRNLNIYWRGVFDKVLDRWLTNFGQKLDAAVASAMIYIDAAVLAYNESLKTKDEDALKKWQREWEEDTRSVLPVSEYGKSNIDEAFAEVFEYYVMEHKMSRDQVDSFKAVLQKQAGTLQERIAWAFMGAYAK